MLKRVLLLGPLVVLFVVGGIALFTAEPNAQLGKPAPNFTLRSLTSPSDRISLADLRGKPVVLNFWASWCTPCQAEAPELAQTARDLSEDVTFLGVNAHDRRKFALRFVDRYRIPYESVVDAGARTSRRYGATGYPETAFIDRDGRLVGTYVGAFTKGQLAGLVEQLVRLRPGELLDISGRGETQPAP